MSTASQFFKGQTRETLVSQTTGKADFLEKVEQRKSEYAGSGFAEWGKHRDIFEVVNEGLTCFGSTVGTENRISLSYPLASTSVGISRTEEAIATVGGVKHHLFGTASTNSLVNALFPPAPDGTKTYDSATGVVTEHASAAEAFNERKDTIPVVGANVAWNAATITATSQTTSPHGLSFSIGKPTGVVKLIAVVESSGNRTIELRDDTGTSGAAPLITSTTLSAGKVTSIEIEYIATTTGVYFRLPSSQVGQTLKFHSIQILTSTEAVITSRKDLVFLETWHEAISDKDQVYPLGNVQYGATTYEGITLAIRNDGYTRFGEWDSTTTGRHSVWSTLTDAQKRVYINDPDNNIYYDSDADELIQVRYRVRVVEGLGDDWLNLNPNVEVNKLSYSTISRVQPKGLLTTVTDYTGANNAVNFRPKNDIDYGSGTFTNDTTTFSHSSVTHATPIALIQRMNQGAYHPTYNPMGCNEWWVTNTGSTGGWYDSRLSVQIVSTEQCFAYTESFIMGRPAGGQYKKGNISSARSGRSDQYSFYDAIYAGQVEDLRLNANKLDVNQLREESIRKAVAGEMRGKGRVPFTSATFKNATSLSTGTVGAYAIPVNEVSGSVDFIPSNQTPVEVNMKVLVGSVTYNILRVRFSGASNENIFIETDSLVTAGGGEQLTGCLGYQLSPEFDSLPWVDIIGDPERIAATFPDGVVGQWIPQIPDSSTRIDLNTKCKTSTALQVFTDNDGTDWSPFTASVSNITNTIPSILTDRVMLVHYETHSNFTEGSVRGVVVGSVGKVYASSDNRIIVGNRLQYSTTGTIGKSEVGSRYSYHPVNKYAIPSDGKLLGQDDFPLVHTEITFDTPSNSSPAVKALPTIIEKNGLYYLQLNGNELTYTSNSFRPWGDDSTVPILDNEGTKTDLNNNTVKTFCHHTQIPLGIKSNN